MLGRSAVHMVLHDFLVFTGFSLLVNDFVPDRRL
jgi:hypothetical protein